MGGGGPESGGETWAVETLGTADVGGGGGGIWGEPTGGWTAIDSTDGGIDSRAWMELDRWDRSLADVCVSTSDGFCCDINLETSWAHCE